MKHLKSMTAAEIGEVLKTLGQPSFRAKQVFSWLHKGVKSYDEMTNLPKALRDELAQRYPIHAPEVVRKQTSKKDGTIKYLWKLSDGNCVETVLMRYHYGNTVCISTEVGCKMGCAFCASTLGGLVRQLEPFEMLDQVLFTQLNSGLSVSHIVLMGIGEPLDNLDNVLRFLELVNSPEGMNISMRHISLSTCGLVPKIDALGDKKLQISLAISLHGPNNEIRNRIMPVNKAYPIEELLIACRRYYAKTSRRIHFEYAMIDGLNDSVQNAKELLALLKGLPSHVNLIPLNHVEESPLKPSTKSAVAAFQKTLEDGGVTATVRRTLGSDIDASCGQLRRKYTKERTENR
ncbi:MAG: 23S rRNA (adenine(2503)-C(2))-methyltransferase RlmN [Oscillospiraceae bacterium]|nr:23S rRNA (adenine(2503)-C(2))-methyltransferase RlmN [Oscillospiraceae bacterium]